MKNFVSLFTILLAALIGLSMPRTAKSDSTEPPPVYEFKFDDDGRMDGWSVTKEAEALSEGDHLLIRGTGWDSKIYRKITLPAGRYVAFGEASGKAGIKIVGVDWKDYHLVLNLSSNQEAWKTDAEGWRIDYRDFDVPGGDYYLVVQVLAESGDAKIRSLKIQTAPPKNAEQGMPSPEALAASTATLPIVRGFMAGYFTDETFPDMRQWGADVARLNVWPPLGWPKMARAKDFWETQMPVLLDTLEKRVAEAQKAGVKVALVCMYPPPVGGKMLDHGEAEFWANPATAQTLCRFWKLIVERVQPYKAAIYGYDLFNEPLDWGQMPYEPREWRGTAIEIIKTIRGIDKDTWIIYEPGPGGLVRGFEKLVPLPDDRVIYSPHFYYPSEFVAQGVKSVEGTDLPKIMEKLNVRYPSLIKNVRWDKEQLAKVLQPVVDFQKEWNVPIYVGEFSVIRWAPKGDAVKWLKDSISLFEANGWSWTYHAFREANCWSLEHDEKYWVRGSETPAPVAYETERAKVIKEALKKNWE